MTRREALRQRTSMTQLVLRSHHALVGLLSTALLSSGCVDDAGIGNIPEGSGGGAESDSDGGTTVSETTSETDGTGTGTDTGTDTDTDTDTGPETALPGSCERIAAEPGDLHDWAIVCGSGAADTAVALAMTPAGDTLVALEIRTFADEPSPTWELEDGTYEHQADSDALLLRFDPDGELVWSRYHGSSSFLDIEALTSCGEDVVVGGSTREAVPDFGGEELPPGSFLTRFDAQGNVVWSRTFEVQAPNGGIRVRSVSCDADGNVFAAGTVRDGVDFGNGMQPASVSDGFVAKYDPSGGLLFSRTLNADPNADGVDAVRVAAVATHTDGTAFLLLDHNAEVDFGTGPIAPPYENENALLARLSADGELLWTTPIGGDGLVYATSLAVNPNGRALISGTFLERVDLGEDTFENTFPFQEQEPDLVGTNYDVYVAAFESDGSYAWGLPDGEMLDDELIVAHFGSDQALGVRQGETRLAISEYSPTGREELLNVSRDGFGFVLGASTLTAAVIAASIGEDIAWPPGAAERHVASSDALLVHLTL